jgi:hypothetical protein
MARDDFFDIPEMDVFDGDVETLVILAYEAGIAGIDRLDTQRRPRPVLAANPGLQMEIDWWDQQISAMRHHTGNTGLVSLVVLFDSWLAKKYKKAFPNITGEIGWKSRFEQLENRLLSGPLSPAKLEEIRSYIIAASLSLSGLKESLTKSPKGSLASMRSGEISA